MVICHTDFPLPPQYHFERTDTGLGERNGNLLQYSCLENILGRAAWQATVHEVTESDMTLPVCTELKEVLEVN